MSKPSEGKLLYHMTRLENMPSILEHGLLSRKRIEENNLNFENIANPDILAGRENVQAPHPLSEYVPFHFFAGNPFDYGVCRTYGSENMVIITIYRSLAQTYDFPVITAHPLNQFAQIYSYRDGISKIDWSVLDKEYPERDYNDNDIKQKCMAECIVPSKIPTNYFAMIFVYNEAAKAKIQKMPYAFRLNHLNYAERTCYINVAPHMFP